MSKSAHVVDGEASESDSEIEIAKSLGGGLDNSQSFVIAGEAPESDEEDVIQPIVEEDVPVHPVSPFTSKIIYNSLLHQKLWECNVSLRATVEGLLRHTTDISVEKLTSADKTLLSVQESMRSTNANLTLARARLKQIHTELENANSGAVFPTLKIKQ